MDSFRLCSENGTKPNRKSGGGVFPRIDWYGQIWQLLRQRASLSDIIAAPSMAAGAAGKATNNIYNVRNTKLNVRVTDPAATSPGHTLEKVATSPPLLHTARANACA